MARGVASSGGRLRAAPDAALSCVRAGDMRVLLVEDQQRLRHWLRKGLVEADFVVDDTGEGKEALWYALGNDYDAIVLDLMIPGLDGLSVLRQLREAGRAAPVLILTA